ncbi:hypothetical protein BGX27_010848 [Mortierella sp. AM989]|nr:hypothetical protein BGX27_010848 [Mortierella sp. AM989]
MIDLSVSWTTSNPIITELPDGPTGSAFPSTISPDKQSWFTFVNDTGYTYDFKTKVWSSIFTDKNIGSTKNTGHTARGLAAATDPDSGITYVPGGYIGYNTTNLMLRMNIATKSVDSVPMYDAQGILPMYVTAWSTPLKSLITLDINGILRVYNPTRGWSSPIVKGKIPSVRNQACFLPVNGGSQMVLYGGYSRLTSRSLNDIYILDVATMTWRGGLNATIENGREAAACAISNGFFIVWGGVRSSPLQDDIANGVPLVYELKTNTWVGYYTAPLPVITTSGAQPSTTTASGSPPNTSDNNTSNANPQDSATSSRTVMILGSVVGVLAVMFAIAGFLLYRRRTRRARSAKDPSSQYPSSDQLFMDSMIPKDQKSYAHSQVPQDHTQMPQDRTLTPQNYSQVSEEHTKSLPPSPPHWEPPKAQINTLRGPAAIVSERNYAYPPPPSDPFRSPSSMSQASSEGSTIRMDNFNQHALFAKPRHSLHPHTNAQNLYNQPSDPQYIAPPSSYSPATSSATATNYHIPLSNYQRRYIPNDKNAL